VLTDEERDWVEYGVKAFYRGIVELTDQIPPEEAVAEARAFFSENAAGNLLLLRKKFDEFEPQAMRNLS
jgi:hypothetical protein